MGFQDPHFLVASETVGEVGSGLARPVVNRTKPKPKPKSSRVPFSKTDINLSALRFLHDDPSMASEIVSFSYDQTPDLPGLHLWGCSSPPSPRQLGLRFRLKGESCFLWLGVAVPTMVPEGGESLAIGAISGGRSGKGRRLWKKVKYQLVEYHSLPGYLKDNEYILGYYRSEWPLKQILLSIFTVHNETLNVWT